MKPNDTLDSEFVTFEDIDLSTIKFSGKNAGLSWEMEQAVNKIKLARVILFLLSGVIFLRTVTLYLSMGDHWNYGILANFVLVVIFVLCGLRIHKQPKSALFVALGIYTFLFVVSVLFLPLSGFLWDVVIIVILSYALSGAFKAEAVKEKLIAAYRSGNI